MQIVLLIKFMNSVIYTDTYQSPCGLLRLGTAGDRLCMCDWQAEKHSRRVDKRLTESLGAEMRQGFSCVMRQAKEQLDEYFAGRRKTFSVPLLLVGTDLQKRVWQELQAIPYGETVSYAEQARRIGNPNAVRAVANAIGANALSIFVPCHRVISADRTIGGYAGGTEAKRWLQAMEKGNAFR